MDSSPTAAARIPGVDSDRQPAVGSQSSIVTKAANGPGHPQQPIPTTGSLDSVISTPSPLTMSTSTTAVKTLPLLGKGSTFIIYEIPDAPQYRAALKIGPDDALAKEQLHGENLGRALRNLETFCASYKRKGIPKIRVPRVPSYYLRLAPGDPRWSQFADRLPPELRSILDTVGGSVMERILPFRSGTPALLVEKLFVEWDRQAVLANLSNQNCLLRPYLGSYAFTPDVELVPPKGLFGFLTKETSLKELPVHRDQLGMIFHSIDRKNHRSRRSDPSRLVSHIRQLGATFAAMHWHANMDGMGCEFLIGLEHHMARLYVLGFDKVNSFDDPNHDTVRNMLVPAAQTLADYLPDPTKDLASWRTFAWWYQYFSRLIMKGFKAPAGSILHALPHLFTHELEIRLRSRDVFDWETMLFHPTPHDRAEPSEPDDDKVTDKDTIMSWSDHITLNSLSNTQARNLAAVAAHLEVGNMAAQCIDDDGDGSTNEEYLSAQSTEDYDADSEDGEGDH